MKQARRYLLLACLSIFITSSCASFTKELETLTSDINKELEASASDINRVFTGGVKRFKKDLEQLGQGGSMDPRIYVEVVTGDLLKRASRQVLRDEIRTILEENSFEPIHQAEIIDTLKFRYKQARSHIHQHGPLQGFKDGLHVGDYGVLLIKVVASTYKALGNLTSFKLNVDAQAKLYMAFISKDEEIKWKIYKNYSHKGKEHQIRRRVLQLFSAYTSKELIFADFIIRGLQDVLPRLKEDVKTYPK